MNFIAGTREECAGWIARELAEDAEIEIEIRGPHESIWAAQGVVSPKAFEVLEGGSDPQSVFRGRAGECCGYVADAVVSGRERRSFTIRALRSQIDARPEGAHGESQMFRVQTVTRGVASILWTGSFDECIAFRHGALSVTQSDRRWLETVEVK
jgi:hypothetical protein